MHERARNIDTNLKELIQPNMIDFLQSISVTPLFKFKFQKQAKQKLWRRFSTVNKEDFGLGTKLLKLLNKTIILCIYFFYF